MNANNQEIKINLNELVNFKVQLNTTHLFSVLQALNNQMQVQQSHITALNQKIETLKKNQVEQSDQIIKQKKALGDATSADAMALLTQEIQSFVEMKPQIWDAIHRIEEKQSKFQDLIDDGLQDSISELKSDFSYLSNRFDEQNSMITVKMNQFETISSFFKTDGSSDNIGDSIAKQMEARIGLSIEDLDQRMGKEIVQIKKDMYDDKITYNNTFLQHKDMYTNMQIKFEQLEKEVSNQKEKFLRKLEGIVKEMEFGSAEQDSQGEPNQEDIFMVNGKPLTMKERVQLLGDSIKSMFGLFQLDMPYLIDLQKKIDKRRRKAIRRKKQAANSDGIATNSVFDKSPEDEDSIFKALSNPDELTKKAVKPDQLERIETKKRRREMENRIRSLEGKPLLPEVGQDGSSSTGTPGTESDEVDKESDEIRKKELEELKQEQEVYREILLATPALKKLQNEMTFKIELDSKTREIKDDKSSVHRVKQEKKVDELVGELKEMLKPSYIDALLKQNSDFTHAKNQFEITSKRVEHIMEQDYLSRNQVYSALKLKADHKNLELKADRTTLTSLFDYLNEKFNAVLLELGVVGEKNTNSMQLTHKLQGLEQQLRNLFEQQRQQMDIIQNSQTQLAPVLITSQGTAIGGSMTSRPNSARKTSPGPIAPPALGTSSAANSRPASARPNSARNKRSASAIIPGVVPYPPEFVKGFTGTGIGPTTSGNTPIKEEFLNLPVIGTEAKAESNYYPPTFVPQMKRPMSTTVNPQKRLESYYQWLSGDVTNSQATVAPYMSRIDNEKMVTGGGFVHETTNATGNGSFFGSTSPSPSLMQTFPQIPVTNMGNSSIKGRNYAKPVMNNIIIESSNPNPNSTSNMNNHNPENMKLEELFDINKRKDPS